MHLFHLSILLVDIVGEQLLIVRQVCKALEDLLQGGLADRVILKLVLISQFLQQLEQESNRFVFLLYRKLHVVTIGLNDLHICEVLAQSLYHTKQTAFNKDLIGNLSLCVALILFLTDSLHHVTSLS